MGSPRRLFRAFAIFWSVLQFALPMGTLYADAFSAASSTDRDVVHVEDRATANCRAPHADECALCRFLSNSTGTIARASLPEPARRTMSAVVAGAIDDCASPARGHPSSRAPPAV